MNNDGALTLGDPQFNSGIAYLQTISKLIENYHASMMNKDYLQALIIADSIFDEVNPRLTLEQIKELKRLQIIATNSFTGGTPSYSRGKVREYYVQLNNFVHLAKMRLVDKKTLMEREVEELNGEEEFTDEELEEVLK